MGDIIFSKHCCSVLRERVKFYSENCFNCQYKVLEGTQMLLFVLSNQHILGASRGLGKLDRVLLSKGGLVLVWFVVWHGLVCAGKC